MLQYALFRDIKDDSPLAKELSRAMKEMNAMRMSIAPQSFQTLKSNDWRDFACKFYQFSLYEVWANEAIRSLRSWESLLDEYFDTFSGSWEYYSISKRTDCIRKHGSENDADYNEDGSIRTEGLTDEELKDYSVIEDLNSSTGRIIAENTKKQIEQFACDVRIATQIHISDFLNKEFKERGMDIPTTYTVGEDGEMRPMTETEQVLSRALREADGDELGMKIIMLDAVLHLLDQCFTNLKFNNDNTLVLTDARDIIKKTLNADFEPFK